MSTTSQRQSLDAPRPASQPLLDAGGTLDDPLESDSDEYTSVASPCPSPSDNYHLDKLFDGRQITCRASVYETPPGTSDEQRDSQEISSPFDKQFSEVLNHPPRHETYSPMSVYYSIECDKESKLDRPTFRPVSDTESSLFEDCNFTEDTDVDTYNLDRLFDRQKSFSQKQSDILLSPPAYRLSLPPSLDYVEPNSSTMSYQSGDPCHVTLDDSGDPNINHHRLLELVNALAENLGQTPERSGTSDQDDILSGCQINLAFEDTEPDLPFNTRYLDITQSDFDHLPWYFQDSEDDLSNLIYPEEDLSSKRPHSIAVPCDLVQHLQGNSDFLRAHPTRATVGASRRDNQNFHILPERPVSATEFSGHGPSAVSSNNVTFVRSNPARSTTIGVPSRYSNNNNNNQCDNGTISESPEFSRHNPTRSTICCVPSEASKRSAAVRPDSGESSSSSEGEETEEVPAQCEQRPPAATLDRRSSSMGNPRRVSEASRASAGSGDEIDWSWVAGEAQRLEADVQRGGRPSSWLRASMRRVQHFQLGEPARVRSAPPESIPPLPPLGAQVVPSLETTGPVSSPAGGGRDFPRRYSASPARRLEVATTSSSGSSARRSSSCSSHLRRRPSSSSESSDDTPPPATGSTAAPETPTSAAQLDSSSDSEPSTARPCDGRSSMADDAQSPLGHWPHNLSSMLASLGCTLGLFNISRFAIFSVQFGANFILQFLFVSLVLGIPLYTFHASIGQFLAAGVMDMWKISPIFQGIGIALLVSHALIGIYSIVGVSWMFIYFRDSFITRQDHYRWAEAQVSRNSNLSVDNESYKLENTVPDYFNAVVLQRHNVDSENSFGHLKFQVTFNLAVVWMIVFVCLSKGLKSYGKVVYVFSLFPVFGMLILCTKLLGLTATNGTHQVFPETVWSEFFLNTKCWVAATTEAFFTWGLLGAGIMQIASHNRHKHLLHRDVSLVIILTLAILLLAAFLANTCVQLLASFQYRYVPSSFEHMVKFLKPETENMSPIFVKTPVRYMTHSTFIAGCRIILPGDTDKATTGSGYQVLRLATELVPSTFALLGADHVSPFWAVLFYFVLILFGIAQQLAIWHCVITGIMAINATNLKSWETTITFFSCACGFILGLPMTTELGIYVVYFLDYTVGCAWWIMVLYLVEIGAVFVIRGRPYSGEAVVTTLFNKGVGCLQVWAAPMLVFTWNVILPVALMVMCITVFKNGKFRELYNWSVAGNHYWPLWARELGCLIQLFPIIAIPVVGIVQSCRYLSAGPPDLFDRIQLLYRPPAESEDSREQIRPTSISETATSTSTTNGNVSATPVPEAAIEDPPPKYTPPPSYTTATGARIAKLLRQSFRRSMRRITSVLGDNAEGFGGSSPRVRAPLPPPPDYAAVLVEINQALENRDQRNITESGCSVDISVTDVDSVRTSTGAGQSTMNSRLAGDNRMSTLTAADVAHILRSSLRRTLRHSSVRGEGNEQLVHGAVPINHDALASQAKTDENNSSVI